MGVADDGGLLRLPEHLRQRHGGDHAAAQHIPQHVARAHGGQLVGVAHHHQAARGPQRLQQRPHQLQIHHAHLVHDDGVGLQRILGVLFEGHLPRQVVEAHAKTPVDGLGLPARHLPQPLGGPPRRSQQQHIQSHPLIQGHDAPQGCGLAGTRPAGEQQHAAVRRQRHRLPLQGRVGHALRLLDVRDGLFHAGQLLHRRFHHGHQPLRHICLRLIHSGQIAAHHVGDGLFHHAKPLDELVQRQLHRVGLHADELRRRLYQLLPWQEHMAVVEVVAQLVQHGGLQPAGVVAAEAHAQGDGVGDGKIHAVLLPAQEVGVVPQRLHGAVAVGALHRHGQMHRQLVPRQKLHDLPQTRQRPEGGGQLHGALGGDALQGLETLRLLLDDPEGVHAEPLHQPLRRGRPHALEDAGAQIGGHVRLIPGQAALHALRRQLRAVGRMLHPHAGDGHALSGGGTGDAAHHRHRLLLSVHRQRQHRIAVFLVLEDHRLYGTLHGAAFAHSSYSSCSFSFVYIAASCGGVTSVPPYRVSSSSARCRPISSKPLSTSITGSGRSRASSRSVMSSCSAPPDASTR